MSFRELSAWAMGALMTLAGLKYLSAYVAASAAAGWAPPPPDGFAALAMFVIVGSIVVQTGLAIFSPKAADAPADERERPLLDRAGNWSGLVLGGLAVAALVHYLVHRDGTALFHMVVGGLIASQIVEYALQIYLLRRGA